MIWLLQTLSYDQWPKDIPTTQFIHDSKNSYYSIYKTLLQNNSDTVKAFVANIKEIYVPQTKINITACDSMLCQIFTQTLNLTADSYYIYSAFLDSVIDPMFAIHKANPVQFAYSLTVNNNNPHAKEIYGQIQNLAIQLESTETAQSNKYTAITVVGYPGFFALNHRGAQEYASFTQNFGVHEDLPSFNESEFVSTIKNSIQKMREGYQLAGQQLLEYCQHAIVLGVYGSLYDFFIIKNMDLEYTSVKILAYANYNQNDTRSGFYTSTGAEVYNRTFNHTLTTEKSTLVHSSCEVNTTMFMASDFRLVQMESVMNKQLNEQSSIDNLASILRKYPFRTTYTAAILASSGEQQYSQLHKCISIVDSLKNIVSCADPPPKQDAAAITCSIILILLVIAAWIFGCIYSKKYDAVYQYQKNAEEEETPENNIS